MIKTALQMVNLINNIIDIKTLNLSYSKAKDTRMKYGE